MMNAPPAPVVKGVLHRAPGDALERKREFGQLAFPRLARVQEGGHTEAQGSRANQRRTPEFWRHDYSFSKTVTVSKWKVVGNMSNTSKVRAR